MVGLVPKRKRVEFLIQLFIIMGYWRVIVVEAFVIFLCRLIGQLNDVTSDLSVIF